MSNILYICGSKQAKSKCSPLIGDPLNDISAPPHFLCPESHDLPCEPWKSELNVDSSSKNNCEVIHCNFNFSALGQIFTGSNTLKW
jgi:hypothetical protein